jgi:hypothetical protein|tara:strand:+ start:6042 stop:6266 length:225 start_codon:yes stop_codon:yes gene_type:complete
MILAVGLWVLLLNRVIGQSLGVFISRHRGDKSTVITAAPTAKTQRKISYRVPSVEHNSGKLAAAILSKFKVKSK